VKALVIARTNLLRMVRERTTIFFVFILPLLIVLLLGATFGGAFTPRIGVLAPDGGPLGTRLVTALGSEDLEVKGYDGEESLVTAVERGAISGGLILPAGYTSTLLSGGDVTIRYLARPDQLGQQLTATVQAAVETQAQLLRAARFAEQQDASSFTDGLARATAIAAVAPRVTVTESIAGEALFPESLGRFDLGASQELLLFVFLTSLTGASALIATRRLGVSRRMLSTPTSARTVLVGETLGRYAVALLQGLFIMLATLLLFGVDWGSPLGATALLLVFCLVGAGAGMLLGATFSSEQTAISTSLLLGLGLAALGGCMVPLEVFPPVMRDIAHVTPQAWGNDAFAELVRRGGGLVDILPELAILAAYGVALLALATWRLRRTLTA
jgi:ABC-2 type transport system permease protein